MGLSFLLFWQFYGRLILSSPIVNAAKISETFKSGRGGFTEDIKQFLMTDLTVRRLAHPFWEIVRWVVLLIWRRSLKSGTLFPD